ncbi:putative N-acetylgalactosamine kinase [Apostichopus japonicus]|uniref:Putative N-acetylgalactosamine kinase n=1 Tax=Stichopus japonicus TaxID=307972 RepID=A0A2G8JV41_STIJA|nr:putative N-acetylgalactosamine kinase [Apostichopus japonicus]
MDQDQDKPAVYSLAEVTASQVDRYRNITSRHKERYGKFPDFLARAPGRVNIIGEHIDYSGYSVLPMAIQQDIVMAVSTNNSGEINLTNTSSKYSDFTTSIKDFKINSTKPSWYNYFLCGVKGILEFSKLSDPVGLDVTVDGTVPPSAGLSSSSAMMELADICMRCEWYIGTQGGGMDQAICFLAKEGYAKLVDFRPLRATDVKLPTGFVFVIANTCVEMNKAATAHFNVRVVECRLATQIIAKAKGLNWREIRSFGELHKKLGLSLQEMLAVVEEILHQHPYEKKEVCQILGVTDEELNKESLSANTLDVEQFKLYNRSKHVFSEAERVESLRHGNITEGSTLGRILFDGHHSGSVLYECSCKELDELVEICRNAGAIGSRLTGAGWGGCTISIVPETLADSFLAEVRSKYFEVDPKRLERVDQNLFVTQPGNGAHLVEDNFAEF